MRIADVRVFRMLQQDIFTKVLFWIDPIIKYMLLHRQSIASWIAKIHAKRWPMIYDAFLYNGDYKDMCLLCEIRLTVDSQQYLQIDAAIFCDRLSGPH